MVLPNHVEIERPRRARPPAAGTCVRQHIGRIDNLQQAPAGDLIEGTCRTSTRSGSEQGQKPAQKISPAKANHPGHQEFTLAAALANTPKERCGGFNPRSSATARWRGG